MTVKAASGAGASAKSAISSMQNRLADVLVAWDRGSRTKRIAILRQFFNVYKNSTGPEIERALGPSALLLFTRITAWLRLSYQMGYELTVQLSAVALFLQGQRFLTNFMEVGGIQTVIDLLCQKSITAADKQHALMVLIHIANSGRVYREMVCDGAGVDLLIQSMLNDQNPKTLELYSSLFMDLGQGNPRKNSLVHAGLVYAIHEGDEPAALCAATTLRSLQLSKQFYTVGNSPTSPDASSPVFPNITTAHANRSITSAGGGKARINVTEPPPSSGSSRSGSTFEAALHNRPASAPRDPREDQAGNTLLRALFQLLSRSNVKLRFEGTELLIIAANNPQLVSRITNRVLDVLEKCAERPEDEEEVPRLVEPGAEWSTTPKQRQEAACARILGRMIIDDPETGWLSLVGGEDEDSEVDPLTAAARAAVPTLPLLAAPQQQQPRTSQPSLLNRQPTARDLMMAIADKRTAHLTLLRMLRVASQKDIDSLREAVVALQRMCMVPKGTPLSHMKGVIEQAFGTDIYDAFVQSKEFDLEFLELLREAAVKWHNETNPPPKQPALQPSVAAA